MAPSVQFLAGDDNEVTSDPQKLDTILQSAWQPIFRGKSEPLKRAASFNEKYGKWCVQGPTRSIEPITPAQLQRTFRAGGNTAPGLDGWAPAEFKLLPISACALLSRLLNAIEAGADWPQPLTYARCAYLAKVQGHTTSALDFRGLMLMPALYRAWARLRLHQLQPWIDAWTPKAMFAGARGKGAQDA
eukprot:15448902-Alexandrium_andersonii.AAC.1